MKRSIRYILVVALLICALCVSACGATIEGWPKGRLVRGVPCVQTGVVTACVESEDAEGKPYALIRIAEFTVSDMSNYIRILNEKGWNMIYAQNVVGDNVTYSAGKKDRRVHLICNTAKNEMSIEIESIE